MDNQVRLTREMPLTGAQIRGARALLGLTAMQLAAEAQLGVNTIRRAEAVDGPTSLTAANGVQLKEAFRRLGALFIPADEEGGPGVRLAK